MFLRKLFTLLLSLAAITTYSQKNFSYTPENPKAGDVITFTYEPAGDLANTMQKVEAVAYISRPKGQKADELVLTQNGKKYTGSIQTDTSGNLINIAFFVDKKFDNNFNEGYLIVLNDEKGNPNKYSFHVLLDTDDKVIEQFKVEGIPTKFVIDKNGSIRFKSIGFDGSDDKLVQELSAMIDLAAGNIQKAF